MNNRGWAWSKGEETGISPGRVYIVKEIFMSQKGTSQNGYWGSTLIQAKDQTPTGHEYREARAIRWLAGEN